MSEDNFRIPLSWFSESIFPCYEKVIARPKSAKRKNANGQAFALIIQLCKLLRPSWTMFLPQFQSIANSFLDLVSRLHLQVRLMGNCGLNAGISWLFLTQMVPIIFLQCRVFLSGGTGESPITTLSPSTKISRKEQGNNSLLLKIPPLVNRSSTENPARRVSRMSVIFF